MQEAKIFRYVEKRLYTYIYDLEKLQELQSRLEYLRGSGSVHAQGYDAINAGGGLYSDPVSEYYDQIERAERAVRKMRRRVEPVRRLLEDLNNPDALDVSRNSYHMAILEKFYFQKIPMTEFLRLTHWSRTAFYARRLDLVNRARGYLRL